MHSRVFELSEHPIEASDRYSYDWLPDWFYGSIADYAVDIEDKDRNDEIKWFVGFFSGQCKNDGDRIEFTDKALEYHFRRSYWDFLKAASLLSAMSFDAFCGKNGHQALDTTLYELNSAYNDKFGFYVYDHDSDELKTLDAWLREADLTKSYYMGGIINYHF